MKEEALDKILNILHLEDRGRDEVLVRAELEREGLKCRITNVSTREAFLTALQSGSFDVILSDFGLPSFDGLQALAIARRAVPDTPFILVSGTLGEQAAIESLRSGATDYVLKDRLARLGPAVRRALNEAEAAHRRKEAEEALNRERAFSMQLIESSVDGIVAFDRDFRVTTWNPGMERIAGFPRQRAVGRSTLELLPFLKEVGEEGRMQEALAGQSGVTGEQPFSIPETGRKGFLAIHYSPIRDESGQVVGGLAIVHDITERKKLEDQFRQSQKLEAVGRLAAGVAHDFNNMLTAILGYAQLAKMKIGTGHRLESDLDEIGKAGERAAGLTRQLLAFSRQQVLQPRALDLNAVILELDKMLRRLIGADIELLTRPGKEVGLVMADPGQIEQVLLNLVVNARDAMPRGGRLTIETAEIVLDARPAGGKLDLQPGRHVMLAVSDDGVGMDNEVKSRIFEPFFTTKEPGRGTGLGLSTVFGIVKQSGGGIEVYSEPGQGTTFKLYFRRADARAESGASPVRDIRTVAGSETILLVEDDAAVRALVRQTLALHGYRVHEAQDGYEAIRILEKSSGSIDLLITDIVMPGVGASELVARAASLRPEMKVLCVSGYAEGAVLHQAVIVDGMPFLQKPFTLQALVHKVRDVLDGDRRQAA